MGSGLPAEGLGGHQGCRGLAPGPVSDLSGGQRHRSGPARLLQPGSRRNPHRRSRRLQGRRGFHVPGHAGEPAQAQALR